MVIISLRLSRNPQTEGGRQAGAEAEVGKCLANKRRRHNERKLNGVLRVSFSVSTSSRGKVLQMYNRTRREGFSTLEIG